MKIKVDPRFEAARAKMKDKLKKEAVTAKQQEEFPSFFVDIAVELPKNHINHPKIIKKINKIINKLKPIYDVAQDHYQELYDQASANNERMNPLCKALMDIAFECKDSIARPFFDYVRGAQVNNDPEHILVIDTIHKHLMKLVSEEKEKTESEPYHSPQRREAFERFELLNPYSGTYRAEVEAAVLADQYEAIPPLLKKLQKCIDAKLPGSMLQNNYTVAEYNFAYGNHKMLLSHNKSGAEAEALKWESIALLKQSIKYDSTIVQMDNGLSSAYVPQLRMIKSHLNIAKMLIPDVSLQQVPKSQMTKAHKDAEFHYKAIIETCEVIGVLGRFVEAMRASGKVSVADKYSSHLVTSLKTKALAHHALGQEQEALEAFAAMTEADPKFHEGFLGMSVSAGLLGRYKESIEYGQKAFVVFEESIITQEFANVEIQNINHIRYIMHLQIGKSLRSLGKNEEAIKHFSEALQFYEDNFDATYELAATYGKIGHTDMAKLMMEALIINHPNNVQILTALADLYYSDNVYNEALHLYQKVSRLGGVSEYDIYKTHTRIGMIFFYQNRFEEALATLLATDTVEAQEYAAKIWICRDEYHEALIIYKRLLKSYPAKEHLNSYIKEIQRKIDVKKAEAKAGQDKAKYIADVAAKKAVEVYVACDKVEEVTDTSDPEVGIEVAADVVADDVHQAPLEPDECNEASASAVVNGSQKSKKVPVIKLNKYQKKRAKEEADRKFKANKLKQDNDEQEPYDQESVSEEGEISALYTPALSMSPESACSGRTPASESTYDETPFSMPSTPVLQSNTQERYYNLKQVAEYPSPTKLSAFAKEFTTEFNAVESEPQAFIPQELISTMPADLLDFCRSQYNGLKNQKITGRQYIPNPEDCHSDAKEIFKMLPSDLDTFLSHMRTSDAEVNRLQKIFRHEYIPESHKQIIYLGYRIEKLNNCFSEKLGCVVGALMQQEEAKTLSILDSQMIAMLRVFDTEQVYYLMRNLVETLPFDICNMVLKSISKYQIEPSIDSINPRTIDDASAELRIYVSAETYVWRDQNLDSHATMITGDAADTSSPSS